MAVSHVKSDTIADFAATITGFNSQGSTTTIAATDLVRPSDWNSAHNQFLTLSGNTANSSNLSGTNIVFQGGNNVTLSGVTAAGAATVVISGPPIYSQAQFLPEMFGASLTQSHANGTLYLAAFELDNYLDLDKYVFHQSFSSSATTASFSASVSSQTSTGGTGSWGQSGTVLLMSRVNTNETNASYNSIISFDSKTYSMSAGYSATVSWSTNASSATASVTTSAAVGWLQNIDSAGGTTSSSSGTSNSTSFSSTSTNQNSFSSSFILSFPWAHLSGIRPVIAPGSGSNVPPGEYWLGVIQSTATGSTNMTLQRVAVMTNPAMVYYTFSSNNSYLEIGNSVAITSSNWQLGYGSYSSSGNTTTAIGLTAVTSNSSNASMFYYLEGRTK